MNYEVLEEQKLSKLERLMQLPRDSVMDYYDLSNDSIAEFPDLSDYTIKSLDLSCNRLDTVIVDFLPREIVTLNLSNNSLCNIFSLNFDDKLELTFDEKRELYKKTTLREIDLSHNRLTGISISFPLRKIVVSHNDITYTDLRIGTRDISITYTLKIPLIKIRGWRKCN